MKNGELKILILTLALIGAGCSKSSSSSVDSSATVPLYVPSPLTQSGTGTTGPTLPAGSNTVALTLDSNAALIAYVGGAHPLYSPTNFKVTVDMTNDGTSRYYGTVGFAYTDNGNVYQGTFSTGSGINPYLDQSDSNNLQQYAYNVWFKSGVKTVFSAFAQDLWGGLVLVVDNADGTNTGDGLSSGTLSGSIWFRNFGPSPAPQGPLRNCWYIEAGPYDCRSNPVMTKGSIYPTDTYTKLGTFTGLPTSAAFH